MQLAASRTVVTSLGRTGKLYSKGANTPRKEQSAKRRMVGMSINRNLGRLATSCAISIGLLGFGAAPAFADDPVQLPVGEEEVVDIDEGGEFIPEDPTEGG
ncbi:hypothetical protein ACNAW0_01025, partial [Micromonospora sp. SL1-18]|uniref:hypothetical protein n=1 Tax=Micromonospora sp. SL1-18 TaxID=3399128 RepID=UPI003A4DB2DC